MPQLSNASDINISSSDGSNSIDHALADEIGGMDGVKRVFGRMSQFDVPAGITGGVTAEGGVDLISYGEFDLDCLMKDRQLKKGSDISKVYGDSRYVLATWDRDSQLKIGDTVLIGDETDRLLPILEEVCHVKLKTAQLTSFGLDDRVCFGAHEISCHISQLLKNLTSKK